MSKNYTDNQPDDLIRMALCDKISFEEIFKTYGFTENEVIAIMKNQLKHSSYTNWRKRVKHRQYKHRKKFASERLSSMYFGFDLD